MTSGHRSAGAGLAAKMINQLIVGCTHAVLAEALSLYRMLVHPGHGELGTGAVLKPCEPH